MSTVLAAWPASAAAPADLSRIAATRSPAYDSSWGADQSVPTRMGLKPTSGTLPADGGYRYYKSARLRSAVLFLYAYAASGAGLGVLATAVESKTFPVLTAAIGGAGLVVVALWGESIVMKTGLEECPRGFVDHRNIGSRLLLLEDITRFDHRRLLSVDRVYAVRVQGSGGDPIQGLLQGRRVVWDGGETHDIVEVLNTRLEARRAADGSSR